MTKRVEVNIDKINMIDEASLSGMLLLTILFVILKLTGVIGWTWLWVLSPLWLPVLITIAIWVVITAVMLFITLIFSGGKKR